MVCFDVLEKKKESQERDVPQDGHLSTPCSSTEIRGIIPPMTTVVPLRTATVVWARFTFETWGGPSRPPVIGTDSAWEGDVRDLRSDDHRDQGPSGFDVRRHVQE